MLFANALNGAKQSEPINCCIPLLLLRYLHCRALPKRRLTHRRCSRRRRRRLTRLTRRFRLQSYPPRRCCRQLAKYTIANISCIPCLYSTIISFEALSFLLLLCISNTNTVMHRIMPLVPCATAKIFPPNDDSNTTLAHLVSHLYQLLLPKHEKS